MDAGGVGLNLQAASVVILMEPQLKPSTEKQAIDRAHRMGQTLPVVVYRLIAENSIDERVVQLSGFKAHLFEQLARHSTLAEAAGELTIFNCEGYRRGVRSRPVLARKPSSRPGRYCIRRSRVLISTVS
ncbi:MAG: helicase-related protein [Streptosporangiaceae bacterium]